MNRQPLAIQFVWSAENASVEVADRFLQAADATLDRLAETPKGGIFHFSPNAKNSAAGAVGQVKGFEKILLFYFPLSNGVDLVRVVHGSRNLARLFDEGFFSKSE